MAAELAAAHAAETSARAEASKARSAHASCSCELAETQQELSQVCGVLPVHWMALLALHSACHAVLCRACGFVVAGLTLASGAAALPAL